MERVAFLVEKTGERINCMLNPETLVLRRWAGVQQRVSSGGQLAGAALSDDPLLYTGGGHTELELDLLFDLDLDPQSPHTSVRRLTEQIWQLAENTAPGGRYGSPPLVRFIWGREWNLLGVVTAVAERFERFTPTGEPRRSWLRMRFVRVHESEGLPAVGTAATTEAIVGDGNGMPGLVREFLPPTVPPEITATADLEGTHIVVGEGTEGENLAQIANDYYHDPNLWWLIAWFNDVRHPLRLKAGTPLLIPSLSIMEHLHK